MSIEKPSEERASVTELSERPLNILETIPTSEIQVDNYHGLTASTVGVYIVCDDPLSRFILIFMS
jgi:hypothetical protein